MESTANGVQMKRKCTINVIDGCIYIPGNSGDLPHNIKILETIVSISM